MMTIIFKLNLVDASGESYRDHLLACFKNVKAEKYQVRL